MESPSATELATAHAVAGHLRRFYRDLTVLIAASAVTYALTAAAIRLSLWISSQGDGPGRSMSFALTVSPDRGAAVLGVLASIVIALNVIVWSSRSSEISEEVAYARRRFLAQCGSVTGFLAVVTGLAVVFNGAPGRSGLASVILLVGAFVIAALGNDAALILGKDVPVQRRVPDAQRAIAVRALSRVAVRWQDPAAPTPAHPTLRMILDVVAVAAVTAVLTTLLLVGRDVANEQAVRWLFAVGVSVMAAVFGTALAIYSIFAPTLSFLTRDFVAAALCAVLGVANYAIVLLGLIAAGLDGHRPVGEWLTVTGGFVALMTPAALIATRLRTKRRLWLPGRTARYNVHRYIERRLTRLQVAPNRNADLGRRKLNRIRIWVNDKTGMSPGSGADPWAHFDEPTAGDRSDTNGAPV